MQIAFLAPKMNVNGSSFDIQNFILPEVLVHWKFVPWSHLLGSHNKVLRTIVFWADLQHESARGRFSPYPLLTLILLQEQRLWSSLGGGCGTGLRCSSLKEANRHEHYGHCRKCCLERIGVHRTAHFVGDAA
jgi:hypothetical protein